MHEIDFLVFLAYQVHLLALLRDCDANIIVVTCN